MYKIQNLIDVLKAEDGYVEKKANCPTANLYEKVGSYAGSDNWTCYWKDLADAGLTNYQGSYYCIATLFWGMYKAFGLKAAQELCLQKFMINCQTTYNLFKAAGQVYTSPQVGDIVVFWSGTYFHHAELVTSVNGDVVKTFGANTTAVTSVTVANGGGCRYGKTYSLTAMKAAGHKFLRPNYGTQIEEGWVQVGDDWKYLLSDGSYVTSAWKQIDGTWYVFDGSGVMITGWFYSGDQWYYLHASGAMAFSWIKVDGTWYYMNTDGTMHTGWLQDDNIWYYLKDEDGTMARDEWLWIGDKWYVFDSSGVMLANTWFESNSKWYYLCSTGAMYTSVWKQDAEGKWNYLTADGSMATNAYVKDNLEDVYYYVDAEGVWDEKLISKDELDKIKELDATIAVVM